MTEKLSVPLEDIVEETQQDLDLFWETQGVPKDLEIQDEYLKIIVNCFLDERLAPLTTAPDKSPERNQAVSGFKAMEGGPWIPDSKSQVSIALGPPAKYVEGTHHTKHGDPKRAVQETYRAMAGFLQVSRRNLGILDRAMVNQEDNEVQPDAGLIRRLIQDDPELRSTYANYFLAKESLDHFKWPSKKAKKDRQKFFDGALLAASQAASPDRLITMHSEILSQERARERFWTRSITQIDSLPFVQAALADPNFIPPSSAHIRKLSESVAVETESDVVLPELESITNDLAEDYSFADRVPEDVKQKLAAQQLTAQEEQRIENMVEQDTPRDLALRRVLGSKYQMSTEESDREDAKQIAKNANPRSSRPKPRKPGFGAGVRLSDRGPYKVSETNQRLSGREALTDQDREIAKPYPSKDK